MENTHNNRVVCQHKIFKSDCEICQLADELESLKSTESKYEEAKLIIEKNKLDMEQKWIELKKANDENEALKRKLADLDEKASMYYTCTADVIGGNPCCETINRYGFAEQELCDALGIKPDDYKNKEFQKDKP